MPGNPRSYRPFLFLPLNASPFQAYNMGQSLAHLLVQAIFSTKDRWPFLHCEEIRNEIYAYMAASLKNLDCHPIKIGGVEEHVHVFCSRSKNIAFSDLIGRLKGASSKRLKENGSETLGGRMDTVPSPSASPTWNRSRPISQPGRTS